MTKLHLKVAFYQSHAGSDKTPTSVGAQTVKTPTDVGVFTDRDPDGFGVLLRTPEASRGSPEIPKPTEHNPQSIFIKRNQN